MTKAEIRAKRKAYQLRLQEHPCVKCGEHRPMQTTTICQRCYGRRMRASWTKAQLNHHRRLCREYWLKPGNAKKHKKYCHEYYLANKEKFFEYSRLWKAAHPEVVKKKHREYYLKNKEKISQQHKKYYLKNKKKILAYGRDYYAKRRKNLKKYNPTICILNRPAPQRKTQKTSSISSRSVSMTSTSSR